MSQSGDFDDNCMFLRVSRQRNMYKIFLLTTIFELGEILDDGDFQSAVLQNLRTRYEKNKIYVCLI